MFPLVVSALGRHFTMKLKKCESSRPWVGPEVGEWGVGVQVNVSG